MKSLAVTGIIGEMQRKGGNKTLLRSRVRVSKLNLQ